MSPNVALRPRSLADDADRAAFHDFITTQTFPQHRRQTWTRDEVDAYWGRGRPDCLLLEVVVDNATAGYVELDGIEDESVTLDLRLADDWRGRGVGRKVLEQLCTYVFTQTAARRLEGVTREGNEPMRRVFAACGFVLESYYRDGWEPGMAGVGYSRLRSDWAAGTTTPVPWDELLETDTHE